MSDVYLCVDGPLDGQMVEKPVGQMIVAELAGFTAEPTEIEGRAVFPISAAAAIYTPVQAVIGDTFAWVMIPVGHVAPGAVDVAKTLARAAGLTLYSRGAST